MTVHAHKVCIVGSGGTGSEIAHCLARDGWMELTLIDLNEDLAIGKALDIGQAGALWGEDVQISAGQDLSLMEGAHIIVITAGRGRRPGEAREAMLADNARLVAQLASAAARLAPEAFLIVLTNPADLLTHVAYTASGFPVQRVLGQGGILDSARLSGHIARALNISVKDVRSLVLGGHGDSMVPVLDFVTVHGAPVRRWLPTEQWHRIVEETRHGGEALLKRFKTHGAAVTPGLAVCAMVDALCRPVPRLLPVSTMPSGEYGLRDVFIGLPALVSCRGVEAVIELPLTPADLALLHTSADRQRTAWSNWTHAQT